MHVETLDPEHHEVTWLFQIRIPEIISDSGVLNREEISKSGFITKVIVQGVSAYMSA